MTAVSPNKPRRRGGKPPLLPEHLLAKLWRAREGRSLRTVDGRKVTVVYAGRPAPGHGPDFQDAVLEMDNRRSTGDVELHRVPSDWHAHGHGADPAYDGVVLHVVARVEERTGPDLPVAELRAPGPRPQTAATAHPILLEQLARAGSTELRHALVRSGMARFEERAASAALRATEAGAEQALHEAVFDALGYAENRTPFLRLARAAPYRELRRLALAYPPDAQDERESRLARRLLDIADLGSTQQPPWRTSGVRPANHPRRRILGAASLVARTADDGLLAACSIACTAGPSALEQLLTVTGGGGSLIGAGRAREAAVNAVLPVIAAQAMIEALPAMSDAAAEAYRRFPALPDNSVSREARRLAGAQGMRLSACEQLGLMRLYRRGIAGS